MSSKLEKELLKALGIKGQGPKEKRDAYLERVAEAVNDMDEDDYEELSEAAKDWFVRAVKASDKGKDVPEFEEEEEEEEKPKAKVKLRLGGKKKPDADDDDDDKKKKDKKKKDDDDDDDDKPAKKKKKEEKKKKKQKRWDGAKDKLGYRNMAEAIRHIVFSKPKLSYEEVKEKLEERGFTGFNDQRAYDNYIHAKGALKVLEEMGKL